MCPPPNPDNCESVHPSIEVYWAHTRPFINLSDEDKAIAVLENSKIFQRYCMAQSLGPQLYNYVTSTQHTGNTDDNANTQINL